MTIARMVELLAFEHTCMLRNSHGDCDRCCENCNLVQDDGELHEMYTDVIALLKAQEPRLITDADFENKGLVDSDGAMPAWIEYRRDEEWDEYNDEKNDEWSLVYQFNFESEFYRCWTSRPTEAEREATPWRS